MFSTSGTDEWCVSLWGLLLPSCPPDLLKWGFPNSRPVCNTMTLLGLRCIYELHTANMSECASKKRLSHTKPMFENVCQPKLTELSTLGDGGYEYLFYTWGMWQEMACHNKRWKSGNPGEKINVFFIFPDMLCIHLSHLSRGSRQSSFHGRGLFQDPHYTQAHWLF